MNDEDSRVDVPAFTLAAVATPIVLFGASLGVFNSFHEHSGSVYREIAGVVMAGVVFGLPFYAAVGLPLAWFVLRTRMSGRAVFLIPAALGAGLVGTLLTLLMIGAGCLPFSVEFLCTMLPIYAYFGLPFALLFALVFAAFFIGFRALRR